MMMNTRGTMCLLGLLGAAAIGCSDGSTVVDQGTPAGTNGGPCYGNGSCNAGLSCVASVCGGADATADDSAGNDTATTGDAPPTADSAATDANATADAPATDSAGGDATPLPYATTTLAAACDDLGAAFNVNGVKGDDTSSNKTALPFAFSFFGSAVTEWSMSSNGFAQLWASSSGGTSTEGANVTIPTAGQPNGLVAPFWDDLAVDASNSSEARAGALGTAPNRRFVISWVHWTTKGDPNNRVSFQAKLFETTNVIELHYCGMQPADNARANGSSATVGLESLSGTAGVLHAFNVANSVGTNKALRFTP